MNHSALKKFAQATRSKLRTQIASRLDYVLHNDDAYLRSHQREKNIIASLLEAKGEDQLLEETAYIWFNRLTALRFMDNRGFNLIRIVSPSDGESQPQLLSELHQGRTPREIESSSAEIQDYLRGDITSADPDREAYKIALLAWCNAMADPMPFLFQRIDDWAALLLPQDLLSEESVITDIQRAIAPEDCGDVEIIGWLYQYYISEKKDEVFAGLKKNKKITRENIPAATQLFTPEWIVRYMVENSLGRLWLNNNPASALKEKMRYFVETDPEQEILTISGPEEIKLIDPCCGSGHILVYAFDLLYSIYEEEGYSPQEIPEFILQNNLYGVDIDDRAASLAAFSLTMKALEKDRGLLQKGIQPHVIAVQDVEVETTGLSVSREMATSLDYLKDAKNLGSLILVSEAMISEIARLQSQQSDAVSEDWIAQGEKNNLAVALLQLEYLSPRYHCVVTNPPYMGGKGMNETLGNFVKTNYPDSKSDLFAVFMEKGLELACLRGYLGMINQQSWMFLSSYEKLRAKIVEEYTILSMAHLGARAFDSIAGEVVQTTSFVIKASHEGIEGKFQRLIDGKSESEKESMYFNDALQYSANASDFSKIPGSPIAYWVSEKHIQCFEHYPRISQFATSSNGVQTGNNALYVRSWSEVSQSRMHDKWFPYNKGGSFRKWYGNYDFLVNWEDNGKEIKSEKNFCARGEEFYFQQGITWSDITSGKLSGRLLPVGFLFDAAGPSAFFNDHSLDFIGLALLNTTYTESWSKILNPTLHFQSGDFRKLTLAPKYISERTRSVSNSLVLLAKQDWDSYETSWDFASLPLMNPDYRQPTLKASYEKLRSHWHEMTLEMRRLEEENNIIFIDAYGLQGELSPEVPLNEITLTCNPRYRYGNDKSEEKLESLLLADTMRELISYAVGCIFGRYSLDKEGLILANASERLDEYRKQIPNLTFKPDESGILPITNEDDFSDDLPNQFKAFLRASFGDDHFSDNLKFIDAAIGKNIRMYFVKDFYNDHIQLYRKRPIYWMVSSPFGSFRALIYLHRYTRDTISVFLNDYLRPYQKKLAAKASIQEQIMVSGSSTGSEKSRAQKELDRIRKIHVELEAWERGVVYPMATQRIELDLDDGVKVNYGKLGAILEKVKGLNA